MQALPYTDRELFDQVCQGQRQAFSLLYRQYWRKLYSFAFNATRSDSEAKDLVQEFFADFWLHREKWSTPHSVNAFFYTALRNRILDHIRKQNVRSAYVARIMAARMEVDNQTMDIILGRELEEQMQQALQESPQRCREIFELSRFQYYSVDEIAQRLDLSPQTVKNQLTKALSILRANYAKYALISFLFLT